MEKYIKQCGEYRKEFVQLLKEKYKANPKIHFVNKVIDQAKEKSNNGELGKIDEWIEIHIEQSDELINEMKKNDGKPVYGIVDNIGTATRGEYYLKGKKVNADKLGENINFSFHISGSADHTGGKPMEERKDAMLSQATLSTKIIEYCKKNNIEIKAMGFNTNTMITNQVAGEANLNISLKDKNIEETKIEKDLKKIIEEVKKETHTEVNIKDGLDENVNNVQGYETILASSLVTIWMYKLACVFQEMGAGKVTIVGGNIDENGKLKFPIDVRMLGRSNGEDAERLIETTFKRAIVQSKKRRCRKYKRINRY